MFELFLSNNLYTILRQTFEYYLIFNLSYYLSNAVLFLTDYYNLFFHQKINTSQNNIIDVYKKCIPSILFNTLIASVVPSFIMAWAQIDNTRAFSIGKCIFDLIFSIILVDVFLYIMHRIFHIPYLYQTFHKKHHEIISPIGFSSLYMTTTDFYLGNTLPTFLPMYIMGAHRITTIIWLVGVIINTTFFAHSGYWMANYHDKHHSLFNKNYGADVFMDKLFQTYSN